MVTVMFGGLFFAPDTVNLQFELDVIFKYDPGVSTQKLKNS